MPHTRRTFLQGAGIAAVTPAFAANDRVRVAVIGCGARSHELMRHLYTAGGAEITAVVDAYDGRAERAQDRCGKQARRMKDYREALADKSIDAVMVVTPDHWHKQMVLDAIAAGKDVYCEKPLTFRSAEGLEIIAAAKAAGKIVQVGSQVCSSAVQHRAKQMIQTGKLGRVTMIRAAYSRNTASGAWIYPIPPDASPQTVNWDMFQGPAKKHDFSLERFFRWRCYQDYSGGIATDLFVHLCTTIHFLMNAKVPAKVMAMGQLYRWKDSRDVPDTLNAILEYPEGFVVNLSSTFNNQISGEGSFQILGTEGSLELASDLTFYPERAYEDNRWIVESWPRRLEDAYWKDPKVRQAELVGGHKQKLVGTVEKLQQLGVDMTVPHLQAWVNGIRTRKGHWEDATVGHRSAGCAHMVNLSARERRMVEWDLAKDDIKG
ncbi:MAG: Gfo/Idh/MocA family oxidoreductase [Bryobacteraceae bacterium]